MAQERVDVLLTDAVHAPDSARRDAALTELLEIARRMAHGRSPAHADSVAQSAVAYIHERAADKRTPDGKALRFKSEAELLAFLRQVVSGKAIDRIRADARHLGPQETSLASRLGGEETAPATAGRGSGGPGIVTLAGQQELRGPIHDWLARFPQPLHGAIAELVRRHCAGQSEPGLDTLSALEPPLRDLAACFQRVLNLLPEDLRPRMSSHIGTLKPDELAAALADSERLLSAAADLSERDRQVVQMREAGLEPKAIADRLNLSPENVRVIHHRFRAKAGRSHV